ncbi:GGDEF domain-containing protein [Streptomyces sp. NPDC001904]|uniref:GGDEF domain-containing protein n=1 Tax=Streptomyces sp. NPDC001904 TaxID=3154531 RepID=UPI00333336DC
MLISAQDRRTSTQYSVIVQSSLSGRSPGEFVAVVEVEVPGRMRLSDQPWSSQFSWQNRASLTMSRQLGRNLRASDLDHFKQINDTHGLEAGDAVLAVTGERLARWAGPHGTVGRLGGDEFAITTRCQNNIEQHLNDLIDALNQPVPTKAGPLPVAASVGAALPRAQHERPQCPAARRRRRDV